MVKFFLHKNKDLCLDSRYPCERYGGCNPRSGKVENTGSAGLLSANIS